MMTIIITVNQPRPDWGGMNIKRFVYLKDFSYFNPTPDGIHIDNESIAYGDEHMDLDIPSNEISNVSIMYPK